MIGRSLLILLLLLPQVLAAERKYSGSFIFSSPTESGNLVIWETKWPAPSQYPEEAKVEFQAKLYLVGCDEWVVLLDRENEQIVPEYSLLAIIEEASPRDLGVMIYRVERIPRFWFEVLQTGKREAVSKYRIELPSVPFPACVSSYLASLEGWAFVFKAEERSAEEDGPFERWLFRIARPDGRILAEAPYSVPRGSSLVGTLLDTSDSHIGLLMREFRSEPKGGPRIYAVTFNLSDLSKGAASHYLTDEDPLDADTLAFSCDRNYFSAFHKAPGAKRSLVSIWALSSGRIAQIAGPTAVPDMPGKSNQTRMGWSVPGDRLVFASCNGETLHLTTTDRTLNVVARRAVVTSGDLSPCTTLDCWHYFDHEDCLIYHIPPPRPWRIIRYDFKTNKAKVLKKATYGVGKILKDAKKPSPPTAGK